MGKQNGSSWTYGAGEERRRSATKGQAFFTIPIICLAAFGLNAASRFVIDTFSWLDQSGLDCLLAQKC